MVESTDVETEELPSTTGVMYKPQSFVGLNIWTILIIPIWVEGVVRFLASNVDSFPETLLFLTSIESIPIGSVAILVFFIFLAMEIVNDFSYSSPYTIQISERGVSGPQTKSRDNSGSENKSKYDIELIQYSKIDWDKSFQDGKLGYQHIYALDGRVIFLHPRLGKLQIDDIEIQCRNHAS